MKCRNSRARLFSLLVRFRVYNNSFCTFVRAWFPRTWTEAKLKLGALSTDPDWGSRFEPRRGRIMIWKFFYWLIGSARLRNASIAWSRGPWGVTPLIVFWVTPRDGSLRLSYPGGSLKNYVECALRWVRIRVSL